MTFEILVQHKFAPVADKLNLRGTTIMLRLDVAILSKLNKNKTPSVDCPEGSGKDYCIWAKLAKVDITSKKPILLQNPVATVSVTSV